MEGFKLVPEASRPPGKCIASRDTQGPFIDTGNQITERGHVYVSARWVEEVAQGLLGMVPKREVEAEVEELREGMDALGERQAELHGLVAGAEEIERSFTVIEGGAGNGRTHDSIA